MQSVFPAFNAKFCFHNNYPSSMRAVCTSSDTLRSAARGSSSKKGCSDNAAPFKVNESGFGCVRVFISGPQRPGQLRLRYVRVSQSLLLNLAVLGQLDMISLNKQHKRAYANPPVRNATLRNNFSNRPSIDPIIAAEPPGDKHKRHDSQQVDKCQYRQDVTIIEVLQ